MFGGKSNIFGWWGRGESSLLEGLKQTLGETATRVASSPAITGRLKTPASILAKMRARNLAVDEVHDRIGLRVLVDEQKECFAVLDAVHSRWTAVPGFYKDYIQCPKPNGYQSLHTVLHGPGGLPFEVQIRTREMHRLCERGPAAHRIYKAGQLFCGFDGEPRRFSTAQS